MKNMKINETFIKLENNKFKYVDDVYDIDKFEKTNYIDEKGRNTYRYENGLLIYREGYEWFIY